MKQDKLTLEKVLREIAKDIYSPTAKRMSGMLSDALNMKKCLVLHLVAIGHSFTDSNIKAVMYHLVKAGYVYSAQCPNKTRHAVTGQIKVIYRLTDKGEAIHADIVQKFTPVVDRMNAKCEGGGA